MFSNLRDCTLPPGACLKPAAFSILCLACHWLCLSGCLLHSVQVLPPRPLGTCVDHAVPCLFAFRQHTFHFLYTAAPWCMFETSRIQYSVNCMSLALLVWVSIAFRPNFASLTIGNMCGSCGTMLFAFRQHTFNFLHTAVHAAVLCS